MERMKKQGGIWQEDLFGGEATEVVWRKGESNEEQIKRYKDLARGEMVRVGPEEYAWVPRENCVMPKYVVCRWVKAGDGKCRPVPVGGRFVRLCPEVAAELGFRHLSRRVRYETIMRLWRADMVELVKISPQCYLLDLESWFRHLSECAENPEMWDKDGEAIAEYRFKNGLG